MMKEILLKVDLEALEGRQPLLLSVAGPKGSQISEFGRDPEIQLHWASSGWNAHCGSDSRAVQLSETQWAQFKACSVKLHQPEDRSVDVLRTHTVFATPELVVRDESGKSLTVPSCALPTAEGARFVIGRAEDCDLRLTPRSISRTHCVIVVRDGQHWIEDAGSACGNGGEQPTHQESTALVPWQ